ncbi:MAG TPA: SSI family serine proteinase inhibitor [Gaiellaceae bacterium]|nr:SSI family serine proteinase inhibitor [Gaiellaceae bacterium]
MRRRRDGIRAQRRDEPREITVFPEGRDEGGERSWTLTCKPVGGTLPNAEATCAKLNALRSPWAEVRPGTSCTLPSFSPTQVVVSGVHRGASVDTVFGYNGSCQLPRWERVDFLFPIRLEFGAREPVTWLDR